MTLLRTEALRLVAAEGLRPLAARTGIPVGQLRSLVDDRDVSISHVESIAEAFNFEIYIGPRRPPVPPPIAAALGLPPDATVAESVAAIERRRDPRVQALLEAAAALERQAQELIRASGQQGAQRPQRTPPRVRDGAGLSGVATYPQGATGCAIDL